MEPSRFLHHPSLSLEAWPDGGTIRHDACTHHSCVPDGERALTSPAHRPDHSSFGYQFRVVGPILGSDSLLLRIGRLVGLVRLEVVLTDTSISRRHALSIPGAPTPRRSSTTSRARLMGATIGMNEFYEMFFIVEDHRDTRERCNIQITHDTNDRRSIQEIASYFLHGCCERLYHR